MKIKKIIAGDIAYWDGSAVQCVSKTAWNSSLGTPVGVVVIPSGMLPDGKARILSLNVVDSNGNAVSYLEAMNWNSSVKSALTWGDYNIDTPLTNYTKVPITDNNDITTIDINHGDYLPSDNFSGGIQSFVDPKAKYSQSKPINLIPSPYLGDDTTQNPAYCEIISDNNALSDFNGLSNTQTLIGLESDYEPANACYNYKDGISNLQWYLPAAGELGFMMVRLKEINDTLNMLGATSIFTHSDFWSSTEHCFRYAYYLYTYNGTVHYKHKHNLGYVRPFAVV